MPRFVHTPASRTRLAAIASGLTAAVMALSLALPEAASARAWELFPFAGYTAKAEIDGAGSVVPGQVTVDGGLAAGFALGTTTPQNVGIEAMWTHQWSGITYKPTGEPSMAVMDMAIDQIHANFLFYAPGQPYAPTKPYFLVGLGANIFNPSNETAESQTEFTWALGVGVKRQVNEKVGLRVQLRYTPTYLSSSDEGYWCDPYYGCYSVYDSNYLDQWDFTGGLVFNLGKS